MYIQSAELNGEKWNKYFFPHEILANGGTLVLQPGDYLIKHGALNQIH